MPDTADTFAWPAEIAATARRIAPHPGTLPRTGRRAAGQNEVA